MPTWRRKPHSMFMYGSHFASRFEIGCKAGRPTHISHVRIFICPYTRPAFRVLGFLARTSYLPAKRSGSSAPCSQHLSSRCRLAHDVRKVLAATPQLSRHFGSASRSQPSQEINPQMMRGDTMIHNVTVTQCDDDVKVSQSTKPAASGQAAEQGRDPCEWESHRQGRGFANQRSRGKLCWQRYIRC